MPFVGKIREVDSLWKMAGWNKELSVYTIVYIPYMFMYVCMACVYLDV